MSASTAVLADAVWPQRSLARSAVLAFVGALLITVCAKIQVPMWPVPMTLSTFAVLLIALVYGPGLGMATVGLYLAQGALGLPVFASGGGIAYFAGPTAGYLVGYLVAAGLVGVLARAGWGRPGVQVFVAMLVGSAVIYLFGFAWLATLIGAQKAWLAGVQPFLVGDAVKAAMAAGAVPFAWWAIERAGLGNDLGNRR
ncbi:MAG: biotin transporter BioY [Pseudomonadota bacterium]